MALLPSLNKRNAFSIELSSLLTKYLYLFIVLAFRTVIFMHLKKIINVKNDEILYTYIYYRSECKSKVIEENFQQFIKQKSLTSVKRRCAPKVKHFP